MVILALVLLVSGGGYAGYRLLSDDTDLQVTAAKERLQPFLRAWQKGEAKQAGAYTDSPADAESLIDSVMTNLKPSRTKITTGDGERKAEGDVQVPFTVNMRIPGVGEYTWDSRARLQQRSGKWTVTFSSPTVHPKLRPGQTLALSGKDARGKILDSEGDELQAASLTGSVDGTSGKGTSGLQARYDDRLSGGKGPRKAVGAATYDGSVPGGPHAKTGTAEFGTDKPPRTHAWMIGYQDDSQLAWSVLLEDGGSGGKDAGPVAARFLSNLSR